jgi:hypothetical protein
VSSHHKADPHRPVEAPQGDEGGRLESIARKLYGSIAAVVAAMVVRKAVERVWVKATGKVPPEEPASPSVPWAEAFGWSALSGTSVALARLFASRRAAAAWRRVSAQSPTRDDNAG